MGQMGGARTEQKKLVKERKGSWRQRKEEKCKGKRKKRKNTFRD